jgi:hypothetical protein
MSDTSYYISREKYLDREPPADEKEQLALEKEQLAFAVRVLKKAREKERGQGHPGGSTGVWLAATQILKGLPTKIVEQAKGLATFADGDRISRVGRRATLMAQAAPDDVIIKVSVAGSGYGNWRTEKEKDDFVPQPDAATNWGWTTITDLATGDCVCYERGAGPQGVELLFAGPGGFETTGSPAKGALDRGSNTIAKLEKEIPAQVKRKLRVSDPNNENKITLLIRSHSRGAVAADVAAKKLKEDYGKRMTVELVAIEPVPGPDHYGEEKAIDIGGLDESTLVMSLSPEKGGWLNPMFTSQQVYGAKRIILSTQNHSAGLSEGFVYNKTRYTGSAMNSLPEGIYVDTNKTAESSIVLKKVTGLANFHATVEREAERAAAMRKEALFDPRDDDDKPGSKADKSRREAALSKVTKERQEATEAAKFDWKETGNLERQGVITDVLRNYLTG